MAMLNNQMVVPILFGLKKTTQHIPEMPRIVRIVAPSGPV